MSDIRLRDARLTEHLACKVMGWKMAPGRFIKSGRSWIPRWRFRPLEDLGDAFQLLDAAASQYKLVFLQGRPFTAEVRAQGRIGRAFGESRARTITLAVARALQLAPSIQATDATASSPRRKRQHHVS
jgi:hypothetical protein